MDGESGIIRHILLQGSWRRRPLLTGAGRMPAGPSVCRARTGQREKGGAAARSPSLASLPGSRQQGPWRDCKVIMGMT